MWDRYIQDLRIELERIIPHKCYWYVLIEAVQTISIDGHIMKIILPLPCIYGGPNWNADLKYRKHNETEIKRVRNIWNQLIEQMKEKLKKIENGESTVEKEFWDGILFEDGKYGLEYKGKMIKRDGVWHTEKIR